MAKKSLVDFQEQLNEQFLEIEDVSLDAISFSRDVIEDNYNNELGIIYETDNFKFFFSLKNFKHISVSANYEPVYLTKKWLVGFVHFRGGMYTVVDLYNILNDEKSKRINKNDSLLFFKNYENTKIAIGNTSVNLEHAGEYTPVFFLNEDKTGWVKNEEIEDPYLFLKEKNMSAREFELVKYIAEGGSRAERKDFVRFVSEVYTDAYGKRPIFVLDGKKILEYINEAEPF